MRRRNPRRYWGGKLLARVQREFECEGELGEVSPVHPVLKGGGAR